MILTPVPLTFIGILVGHWLFGAPFSATSMIGFIALAGVAAETGVVMIMYLEHAWSERRRRAADEGREPTRQELRDAIVEGALLRLRPKLMTVITVIVGLLPIMWGSGTGSEVSFSEETSSASASLPPRRFNGTCRTLGTASSTSWQGTTAPTVV